MALFQRLRASALAVLLVLTLAPAAMAQAYVDGARLDTLFADLRSAASEARAQRIVAQIWSVWTSPDDERLAALMDQSRALMAQGAYPQAEAVLDTITQRWPDYAEGWNRRATVRYTIGDFAGARADIAETLAREPRHFGALSGKVQILLRQGERERARETMIEALEINPFMGGRALFPDLPPPITQV